MLEVANLQGICMDIDTFEVLLDAEVPIAFIETPEVITCNNSIVQLDATNSSQGINFTYLWSGGAIEGDTALTPVVLEIGTYSLTVTDNDNNCIASATIVVNSDFDLLVVDAGAPAFLDCHDQTAQLNATIPSTTDPFSFSWSTINGRFVSGEETLQPLIDQPGIYTITIINETNGCAFADEVVISSDMDGPTDAMVKINNPSCFGENDGSIVIDSVIGGTAPFLYSWDGVAFSTSNQQIRLKAASYNLIIQDQNGCEWMTAIDLQEPFQIQTELGDNIPISLGDSVELQASINLPIDTFFWSPELGLSCVDCLNPVVYPTDQITYQLTVVDLNGCTAIDQVTILVDKQRLVYIPTVFSPNGDGLNDRLTIYGGTGVENINYFRIFDRWGELLYEYNNLPPNNELLGWDGYLDEIPLPSGVYVYVAEVLFFDGFTEKYVGDITLIR